ncbi:MAG: hypothetical protein ACFFDN_17085 [Candidatus Hodarchaeota archaeon]
MAACTKLQRFEKYQSGDTGKNYTNACLGRLFSQIILQEKGTHPKTIPTADVSP